MNNAQQNKEREQLQIERFIELLGFTNNDLFYPEQDPPDAFINSTNGLISLEHTRITIPEERTAETIRRLCVRQAKKHWDECNLPNIRVDILFNDQDPVVYKQINQYSDRIQNVIFNFIGPLHYLKSRIKSEKISCYVALSRQRLRNYWSCVNNSVGWVKRIPESSLQDKISRKNKAIQRYRHNCVENWLLFFIESEFASSMFHLETRYEHESGFDKIFLSDGFGYIELVKRQERGS